MTPTRSSAARTFAGIIAVLAAAGLAIQFSSSMGLNGSYGATLWVLLRFFTIITNALVAVVFAQIALASDAARAYRPLAATVLLIVLVGIVYALLLRGSMQLSGAAWLANTLLHVVTPVVVPLYWIAFAPKGTLRYRHPLTWGLFPLIYLGYALLRGGFDGRYPYPFLDVGRIGWTQTAINCVLIGVGFIVFGLMFVWLDSAIASRARR